MHKKLKIALIIFSLFILINGFKVVLITQLLVSLPWDYIVGKLASEISICGLFILLVFITKKRIFLILFYLLQTIFLFSNMSYYYYFHRYLHLFSWFSLLKETTSLLSKFAIPLEIEMLWLLVDLPVFIFSLIFFKEIIELLNKKNNKLKIKFNLKSILAIIFLLIYICQFIIYYLDSTPYEILNTNKFKGEATFIYFYGFTANSIAVFIKEKYDSNKEKKLVFGPLIEINNDNLTHKIYNKKIFVFQIEAMESTIIYTKYKDQYIMPFLNSLSKNSIYFPFCFTYHKGGNTSDAEFSVINSVEPLNDYPAIKLGDSAFENSFIKKLKESGFDTLVFHGNAGYFFDRQTAFTKAGFNIFFDLNKMKLKEVGWGAEDKEVYTFMLNKLEEQKEPFIYYTISMSSHEPYNLINSVFYDKIFNDINDVRVRNYFNSMRYVDKALEDAITKILRKHPDAIIFIFGDHCSNIRENPYYKNSRVITKSKIAIEFVPLFIVSSELTPYIEKNKVASLLDISPTIIYLSRIKTSIRTFGENLLNPKKLNNSIYFRNEEYSRKELYKLIFNEIKKYMIGF